MEREAGADRKGGGREREEKQTKKNCVYVKEKKVYGGIPFATKCLRTSNILLL